MGERLERRAEGAVEEVAELEEVLAAAGRVVG